MAKNSDVETFCAMRLFIDSWRWEGVPWYLRAGKHLAETATEVLVELKPPPQRLFADSAPPAGPANYLRFRVSPRRTGEEAPYERLLNDALTGDGALFTREDAVEGAWAVAGPVLSGATRLALTGVEVGGRKRLTRLSLQTVVGTTP